MQEQQIAIVTGASKGIGAACARELAANGYRLAVMARSEQIIALAAELDAVATQGSVTEQEDVSRLVALVLDTYGQNIVVDGGLTRTA